VYHHAQTSLVDVDGPWQKPVNVVAENTINPSLLSQKLSRGTFEGLAVTGRYAADFSR
jgi:hypothetical protein